MYPLYFISIIYIAFGGLLLLLDSYRAQLTFMLRIRQNLEENSNYRYFASAFGVLMFILLLVIPIEPGPKLIGDIIPAFASLVIALSIFFSKRKSVDAVKIMDFSTKKYLGFTMLAIAFIHFLLPSFVLL